jgi:hypothetical protein
MTAFTVSNIAWGIPCYNNAEIITGTAERVIAVMQELVGKQFYLQLHDDGSTDGTHHAIYQLSRRHPAHVGTSLYSENRGVAQVIPSLYRDLLNSARFGLLVDENIPRLWMNLEETIFGRCDPLEHDITQLPVLVDAIRNGAAGAIGCVEYAAENLGGGLHGKFDLDAHRYLGQMEGMVALAGKQPADGFIFSEKYLLHHCPGYQVYPGPIFVRIVQLLPEYQRFYQERNGHPARWGMDLVVAAIASRISDGNVAVLSVGKTTVTEQRRPVHKILHQLRDAASHLLTFIDWEKTISWT